MNVLLQLIQKLLGKGGGGGGGQAALLALLPSLLGSAGALGGLGGLLGSMEKHGLADVGQSWVSKGSNLPISPEQLQKVLGQGQIADIAAKLGIPSDKVAGQLAKVLPDAVDRLTPDGDVPDASKVDDALGGLGTLLGR